MHNTSNRMRNARGETLVSLLVSTLIMAICASALLALISINTKYSSGFWNKADVLQSSKNALDRIGRLVRTARSLGDCYGVVSPSSTPQWNLTTHGPSDNIGGVAKATTTNTTIAAATFLVSPEFPSPGDPYYSNGASGQQPPQGGWPGWPNQTINPPQTTTGKYRLSQDTLIVQTPVFVDSNGKDPQEEPGKTYTMPDGTKVSAYNWPVDWNGVSLAPPNAQLVNGTLQAMDTYVFRVIPDPTAPGTFMMQEVCFQACPSGNTNPMGTPSPTFNGHPTNAMPNALTPHTIIRGIVGPKDAQGNISIFEYVEKRNNTSTTMPDNVGDVFVTDYTGVIVNLEVLKSEQGVKKSVAAFRSEYFFRNNTMTELIGLPPPG
jgi:type II secretory pathway pseudopilin PulG